MKRGSTKTDETFVKKVGRKFPDAIQMAGYIFIPYVPDLEYGLSDGRKHFKRWDSNK